MKRRYEDCIRADGLCGICYKCVRDMEDPHPKDIVDCKGKPISPILFRRSCVDMTQQMVADASGINIRQIRRFEDGTSDIGNMTLKNAIALADVLACEYVQDLYDAEYVKNLEKWKAENSEVE
ncbi:hypothetical protein M2145_002558 [Lachnospiraceae bacterium PF1-21]